jgi:hypothetical protein
LKKRFRSLSLTLLAGMIGASFAKADTIYTDLGPPAAPYFDANGRAVTGSGLGFPGYQEVAVPFTPTGSYDLTEIDLAVTFSGIPSVFGTDAATVTLESSVAGAPGASIASWNISSLPSSFTGTTLDSIFVSGVSVTAGAQYWLVVSPTNNIGNTSDTDDFWDTNSNPAGVFGNEQINNGGSWVSLAPYDLAAFDVLGTPVPEPASASLAIAGFALVAIGCAKARRKAKSQTL